MRRIPGYKADEIQGAHTSLLENPPAPTLRLWWVDENGSWPSEFAGVYELPEEVKDVFERTGYGYLAATGVSN